MSTCINGAICPVDRSTAAAATGSRIDIHRATRQCGSESCRGQSRCGFGGIRATAGQAIGGIEFRGIRTGRTDRQICRIEQQCSGRPTRRTTICRPAKRQNVLAGDFDKTAIPALISAARRNSPVKPRRPIRPYDDLATIPRANRISIDLHILADIRRVGVLFRPLTLEVAADQRRATSADS